MNPIRMKHFFLFVAVFCFPCKIISQTSYDKGLLVADLDTLYNTINQVHPNMFAIVSQEEFEKELNHIKESLNDSLNTFEFFAVVAPLIAGLGDGHTTVEPPWNAYYNVNPSVFPYEIEIENNQITIVQDHSQNEGAIPIGSEIIRINGKVVKDILETIISFTSGESPAFRMEKVRSRFPLYFYIIDSSNSFAIEYKHQNVLGEKEIVGIPAGDLNRLITANSDNTEKDMYYALTVDEDNNTAIFDFREFNLDNGKIGTFLDEAFAELKEKKIGNLIIDIRNNGGGNSRVGDLVFQYISPAPYSQAGNTTMKISTPLKVFITEMKDQGYINEDAFNNFMAVPNGIYPRNNTKLIPLEENPLRYNGNIFLLTSSKTFSSAVLFAWAFQYFKMGTIIGEETGGYIVHFGDVSHYLLPQSKLTHGVSWKEFYPYGSTEENRHSVIPDIATPADNALSKALEIIAEN